MTAKGCTACGRKYRHPATSVILWSIAFFVVFLVAAVCIGVGVELLRGAQ